MTLINRLRDHARNLSGDMSYEELDGDEACEIADELERLQARLWNYANGTAGMCADAAIGAANDWQKEVERLHQICRNVYEVWAGSEGIPEPKTCAEAYLLSLVLKMRDEAKEGLK